MRPKRSPSSLSAKRTGPRLWIKSNPSSFQTGPTSAVPSSPSFPGTWSDADTLHLLNLYLWTHRLATEIHRRYLVLQWHVKNREKIRGYERLYRKTHPEARAAIRVRRKERLTKGNAPA